MPELSIDLFAEARDTEAAQYRLLAAFQAVQTAFRETRIFPHLSRLVRLHRELTGFLDELDRHEFRGDVRGIDWERGVLTFENETPPLLAADLARWAMPQLTECLYEGRTLYDFVDEHTELRVVGLLPPYREEGFLILETKKGVPMALRYRVSALSGPGHRYRVLHTTPAEAELDPIAPPGSWKESLRAANPDLPAPATLCLDVDLDFPVHETLLPVGKRKLLKWVVENAEC